MHDLVQKGARLAGRIIAGLSVVFCALQSVAGAGPAAPELTWREWAPAQEQARGNNRPLFVLCGPEHGLLVNELYYSVLCRPAVAAELTKNFILAYLPPEREDIVRQYAVTRFPTILFLTYNRGWQEEDRREGFTGEAELLELIEEVKKKRFTYRALKARTESGNASAKEWQLFAERCHRQNKRAEARAAWARLSELNPAEAPHYRQQEALLAVEESLEQPQPPAPFIESLAGITGAKAQELRARAYLQARDLPAAAAAIDQLLRDYPAYPETPAFLYTLALSFAESADTQLQAAGVFDALARRYPQRVYGRIAALLLREAAASGDGRRTLGRAVSRRAAIAPDSGAFFRALSRWSEQEIFPILLGDKDDPLNRKFLAAFQPSEVEMLPAGPDRRWSEDEIRAMVSKAGKEAAGLRGIVFTRVQDSGLPAAAALVAARGQALEFWPAPETHAHLLSWSRAGELRRMVRAAVARRQSAAAPIEAITLAADLPYRCNGPWGGIRAFDDYCARDADGIADILTGRLIGSAAQCVYQAMCALFLSPRRALFFNTYDQQAPPWSQYRTDQAARMVGAVMPVTNIDSGQATLRRWQEEMRAGNVFGFVLVQSSGGKHDWKVSDGQARAADIPVSVPAVVHFTQSGSAADPYDGATIAGAWLGHGAYIYYGAVAEPFVQAFNPPEEIAGRLLAGQSYARAFRKFQGNFSYPWKLFFVGDPLAGIADPDARGEDPSLHRVSE
ncbi:MAG: hypothetical protein NC924_09545 [Candidatus Omnitrophica bacterium]|nr:hypothetical protein [Candidatus Omnitrophota bacterium]